MKSILKISKERISNTFLSLNLGEVVMKKLNVFELKQVSGGDSLGDRVPEHPITYEYLKNGFQIPFYR